MNHAANHRFFADSTHTGTPGVTELPPPPWQTGMRAEFHYTYDILEAALPLVHAEGLHFYFTKEAYALPAYGRNVVGVLLQEERCKVPVYGRHVRAVLRNLHSTPFLGWRPHLPLGRLEAVETFEYLRDLYTSAKARRALAHPPAEFPAPVRAEPRTLSLPLGYHSQVELPQLPMAERPLDAFFAGQVAEEVPHNSYKRWTSTSKIQARKQIWIALRALAAEGQWQLDLGDVAAGTAGSGYGSYSEKMMQSRICVAPRGSMADTFRSFEGLRAGCLTVANPLPKDPFLYPGAPLLIVDHWRELGGILRRYARNLDALEDYRHRSLAWWRTQLHPAALAPRIAAALNEAAATLLP